MSEDRLRARGLSKRFGATRALAGVDLTLRGGEIHALLGGNGSGKSTLIKILAGVETADEGTLEIGDRTVEAAQITPALAHEQGLRFIHQQGSTFGAMTVAENFAAGTGFACRSRGVIDWRETRRRAAALIDRFGIDARPDDLLETLRPVARQMVCIARALQGGDDAHAGVLVLDEPTASLPADEVAALHAALRRYADAGQAILYVTHRLEELPGFAAGATVLRDGRVAARVPREELHHDRLVELMTGGVALPGADAVAAGAGPTARERLVVRGLAGGPVRSATLTVRAGEIVGLAGLVGSGRSSVLEMLFGLHHPAAGSIALDGETLRWRHGIPHARVALVPENRLDDAAFVTLSLAENLMAASTARFWRGGRIRRSEEAAAARQLVATHGIRAASVSAPFGTLSGGNQQKAVLARWLLREPSVLLLDEPTQGVDIAARAAIHAMVRASVADGGLAVVASTDADELAALCDRVVVLTDGVTTFEISGDDLTPERLEHISVSTTGAHR